MIRRSVMMVNTLTTAPAENNGCPPRTDRQARKRPWITLNMRDIWETVEAILRETEKTGKSKTS